MKFIDGTIIPVWDLPLRLFHWLLVITITASYVTSLLGPFWTGAHTQLGLVVMALIVFRIIWGFIGTTYSRFKSFTPTPKKLFEYFASNSTVVGHSPLGAISIYTLLSLILIQTTFGLFSMNDELDYHGPLYDLVNSTWNNRLSHWHGLLFNSLAALIILHLLAIANHVVIKRNNLLLPMITGKTWVPCETTTQPIQGGGKYSILIAVIIAGTVYLMIESNILIKHFPEPKSRDTTKVRPPW